MPSQYAKEFDFDLARAVVDQLIESLDAVEVGGLTTEIGSSNVPARNAACLGQ